MFRVKRTLFLALFAATLVAGLVIPPPAEAYLNYHPCRRYMQGWSYALTCDTRSSGGTNGTHSGTVPGYPNSVNIGWATIETFSRTVNLYGGYFTGRDWNNVSHNHRYFVCKADQSNGAYCAWA
jgi:hypothetical protein